MYVKGNFPLIGQLNKDSNSAFEKTTLVLSLYYFTLVFSRVFQEIQTQQFFGTEIMGR